MAGLAVRLRALGAGARVCTLPDKDFEELSGRVGVLLVPIRRPMRVMLWPPSSADSSQ
jgi:vancomycin aglycone glucosyltransferase